MDITILLVPEKEKPADLCSKPKSTNTSYINNNKCLNGLQLLEDSNESMREQYKPTNIIKKANTRRRKGTNGEINKSRYNVFRDNNQK